MSTTVTTFVGLSCGFCLEARGRARDAVTIINGHAVCLDHLGYARTHSDRFTQALYKIRRREAT